MRKERKTQLMSPPPVPQKYMDKMQGRNAANFVVLVTAGHELYARCFHRYSKGELHEVQRYAFAKDGAVRYGRDQQGRWVIRTELREPVFYCTHGYGADNSYTVLGWETVAQSDMRYSEVTAYTGRLIISYLCLYCRHPNIEYLVKAGYQCTLVEYARGYWTYHNNALKVDERVDLKSNDLRKMLRLNRDEFRLLSGHEDDWPDYLIWRDKFPKLRPGELMEMLDAFGTNIHIAQRAVKHTGLNPVRLARYLAEKDIMAYDYDDHLRQCLHLGCDLKDTAYSLPRDFCAFHRRSSAMMRYNTDKLMDEAFAEHYEQRRKLEFSALGLTVIQPDSCDAIIREGRIQEHCVGGYAERHAYGKLHILFLRKADAPDKPYYTMEVSTDGKIVQCRGWRNDRCRDKPAEVLGFERIYQEHLDEVFGRKTRRETA